MLTCTLRAQHMHVGYASIFCWEHIFCLIRSSNDRKMYFLNDCLSCHVTLSSNPLQHLDITSHSIWSSSCTRANLSRTRLCFSGGCSKDKQADSQISLNLCGHKILRAYHIHVCMDCTNCCSKNYYMCRYDIYTVLFTALWYNV